MEFCFPMIKFQNIRIQVGPIYLPTTSVVISTNTKYIPEKDIPSTWQNTYMSP